MGDLDSDVVYPKSLYEDAALAMRAAGVDFSLLNAYALSRMIWARFNAEEGDEHGRGALFVAAHALENTLKTEAVKSWTDVRVRINYVKDAMRENDEDRWAELVGQIGQDVAIMRHLHRQTAAA